MEIKKVKNLEELNKLEVGTRMNVINVLSGRGLEHAYGGKRLVENKEVYSFLSFDKKYAPDRFIVDFSVWEEDIKFNSRNPIEIKSHDYTHYSPSTKNFEKKLKIIQGGKK